MYQVILILDLFFLNYERRGELNFPLFKKTILEKPNLISTEQELSIKKKNMKSCGVRKIFPHVLKRFQNTTNNLLQIFLGDHNGLIKLNPKQ